MSSHEKWLEVRRSGITGTDISAIMGSNPWKTPLQVYLEKIGEAEPKEMNERMKWGHILEGVVANEYAERNNVRIHAFPDVTVRHHEHPIFLGSVDRFVGDSVIYDEKSQTVTGADCILEIKTSGHEWDEVPIYYVMQVQWYLGICDLPYADLAALFGGQKYAQFRIERDDFLIDIMQDAALSFWHDHVEKRVAPDPTTPQEFSARFPYAKAASVEANDEVAEKIARYLALKEKADALQKEMDGLKMDIMNFAGENRYVTVNGKKVVDIRSVTRKGALDEEKLKAVVPNLDEFRKPSSVSRSLFIVTKG